jgi:hypothetical protein
MNVETFLAILSAAVLLALAFLALIARLNGPEDDDDDVEQTPIIEAPADEPLGDQVDIKGLMRRYSE